MKKVWIVLLAFSLIFSGLVFNSGVALADPWKNESGHWQPPGLAKKALLNMDSEKYLEKYEESLEKIFSVKKLTRAQTAYIFAQINEEEYEDFDGTTEILSGVADAKAIPKVFRKAVAFVISENLMTYQTQPNGKILFQPNKNITWAEMSEMLISGGGISSVVPSVTTYSGTVRFIYTIGNMTWVAIESSGELRTAYFAYGTRPSALDTGITITVKVNSDKRIIESSLGTITNQFSSLSFSIQPQQSTPEVGEALTFNARLVNTSSGSISLDDVRYRFTLRRAGYSTEWEFTGTYSQDVVIPANNSSNPVILSAPTNSWVPAYAGDYLLVKAQLKAGDGDWQDVSYSQIEETLNLLTLNQSNIETGTTGFSTYGINTFAGSVLTRVTSDQWQGSASLKVATNGGSAWQGVNANYQGQSVTGPLTFSFYIKAPLGTPLRAIVYDQTNSNYPSNNVLEFTASGSWERQSITFTPTAASNDLHLQVTLNNNMSSVEYYLDGLQLEQESSTTTWIPGGTTGNSAIVIAP